MNDKQDTMLEDFDPDTAPDLSQDDWPKKFAEIDIQRGRPMSESQKVSDSVEL